MPDAPDARSRALRQLLAIYYRRMKLAGGELYMPQEVYWPEAVHLVHAGWLRSECFSPPEGSKSRPIYRLTMTRLGVREGRLAEPPPDWPEPPPLPR